jgi:hypothetical protein
LLQPGLTQTSLHDYRLGRILDALFAANLNKVFNAIALKALEVYAIPTPWLHQDTTTIALYGAYEDEPKTVGAPRPAYGHSKDGRDDLKQVLLSLGVSGDGGLPLRLGLRDLPIKFIQLESHNDDMYLHNQQSAGNSQAQIEELLKMNGFYEVARIKHGFGDFYEIIYENKKLK